jgi:hypothetical protein
MNNDSKTTLILRFIWKPVVWAVVSIVLFFIGAFFIEPLHSQSALVSDLYDLLIVITILPTIVLIYRIRLQLLGLKITKVQEGQFQDIPTIGPKSTLVAYLLSSFFYGIFIPVYIFVYGISSMYLLNANALIPKYSQIVPFLLSGLIIYVLPVISLLFMIAAGKKSPTIKKQFIYLLELGLLFIAIMFVCLLLIKLFS